jgi:hypothetical protein
MQTLVHHEDAKLTTIREAFLYIEFVCFVAFVAS